MPVAAMLALLGALLAPAPAPTLDGWTATLGPPTKSAVDSDRVRSEDEPLLVYWMRTQAAPLGFGPALPGTLVANFEPAKNLGESRLASYTFLAVAKPEQAATRAAALEERGLVAGRAEVKRAGGGFVEYSLAAEALTGTLAVRQGQPKGGMADGRPAPSLWLHVTLGPAKR